MTLPVGVPAQLFLNFGSGFHSNDALSAVSASSCGADRTRCGSGALPRALGGEIGVRARLLGRIDVAAAAWILHLESELVFNGDVGGTEPSAPSLRKGVDLELRAELLPWLSLDGDLSLARARFTGGTGAVPLAPTRVATAGVTVRDPSGLGLRGSLRMRHVGDRPANPEETITAQGYTVFDLLLAYRTRRWEVGVVVENLFDTAWRDAQFVDSTPAREPTVRRAGARFWPHLHPGHPPQRPRVRDALLLNEAERTTRCRSTTSSRRRTSEPTGCSGCSSSSPSPPSGS